MAEEFTSQLPEGLQKYIKRADAARRDGRAPEGTSFSEMFGADADRIRNAMMKDGVATYKGEGGQDFVMAADIRGDKVFNVAAAIPRTAGRAENFLQSVRDYSDSNLSRADRVRLFHQIARSEGLISNSINKQSALIASDGDFKVRRVKGVRGKGGDKMAEEFRTLLAWWKENLNARALDAVMTGARGVKSFILQGTRLALIEGSLVGRTIWRKVKVPVLGGQSFNLPMNIQMFSTAHIHIPEEIIGTGVELLYWKPPEEFVRKLTDSKDPNVKAVIQKLIEPKVLNELKNKKQYLLDPSLLIHIKHRGMGIEGFGQSLIEPAMSDIAMKRALQALDVTTIENLINRLVIVKVGSDNPESDYHNLEVANARLQLLQRMFQRVGPSATILWAGPDLDVIEVSAHQALANTEKRHDQADQRIVNAIGTPWALLTGQAPDGKSSGAAGTLGAGAQMIEVQDQFGNTLTTMAERIAAANKYEEVDCGWEFHDDLLSDKEVAANISLKFFQAGLYSTRTALEEVGQNYEAEEMRQHEDVKLGYKDEPFGPPKAALTTNPAGSDGGGGGDGRPTNKERPGEKDPRKDKETNETEERK